MMENTATLKQKNEPRTNDKPCLAFLGVGWIGKNRMESLVQNQLVEVAGIADPSPGNLEAALAVAPEAKTFRSFDEILDSEVDGVVIATPSALHAGQSIAALNKGKAVFCQKPLGRNAAETKAVVEAARNNNLLLGVDLCYRHTCFRKIHDIIRSGELGHIYAAELTFHNAWGPGKDWFYDPKLAGGGCVVDLGIHLIDLALWTLKGTRVENVYSSLFSKGASLLEPEKQVEDYANAIINLSSQKNEKTAINLSCSWNLPAGKEAEIQASFYGTRGGVAFRNINGSFYDFKALRLHGTQTEVLFEGPDEWGVRAVGEWAQRLAAGQKFDPEADTLVEVAKVLDQIYGR